MTCTSRTISFFILPLLIILAISPAVVAQRLHDEARDKEAQKASQLADEITSKSNFDKQLRNLDVLANRDIELYFTGTKRQMWLEIRNFRTWEAVAAFVGLTKGELNTANTISNAAADEIAKDLDKKCEERTTPLGQAVCHAKAKLKDLNDAVAASAAEKKELEEELKSRLEKIDVIESLVDRSKSFLKSASKDNVIVKQSAAIFLNLAESYVNYINKLAIIKTHANNELRLLLQRIAVEALMLEVDYWRTVGEITFRRAEEEKDLRVLVLDVEFRMGQMARCLSVDEATLQAEKISDTFVKAQALPKCVVFDNDENKDTEIPKEEIVAYLFQTLHSAGALAARGQTPRRLSELRLAHETHRFSIRHSAVMARTYEVAFTSGTDRLARFYAGGLRPEKIAQLIYTAATVAIPPVIAAK